MKKHVLMGFVAAIALTAGLAACDDGQESQVPPAQEEALERGLNDTAGPDVSPFGATDGTTAPGSDMMPPPATAPVEAPPAGVYNAPVDDGSAGTFEGAMDEDGAIPPPPMNRSGDSSAVNPNEIPESSVPPAPSREDFTDVDCDYEEWVGQPLDEAAISAEDRPFRIVKPGDPMTMDHRPDRINVEHDDGTVTRVWCG